MSGKLSNPRVRKDGRCVVCKKMRVIPKQLQRGVPALMYERDPFCSATCCRAHYGNPISTFSGVWGPEQKEKTK